MNDLFISNNVTKIGIGTWQMGLKGWGKDYDEKSAIDALLFALKNGVNFVDTAEVYGGGKSETLLGESLKFVDRSKIIVATKIAGYNATKRGIFKHLNDSLRRLQTDYVDLYQIHWEPSYYTDLRELFRSMEKLSSEGLIKHIGVSNFSLEMLKKCSSYLKDFRIESNQVKFNLIERPPKDLLTYMKDNEIKLIAWSPLGQGFLSGKYSEGNKPNGFIRKANYLFSDKNIKRFEPLISTLKMIAKKKNVSVTQLVLAYEAELDVLPIPGFKNVRQTSEIAGALSVKISDEEKTIIEESLNKTGFIQIKSTLFPRALPNSLVRIVSLYL